MKMEASDSKEKQEGCDGEKGSCLGDKDGVLREFVEGSLSSELVNASESIFVETKVEGEKRKDSSSGKKDGAKKGDVAMEGSDAIDLGTSVAQLDKQNCKSDSLSEGQSDSVDELTEGGLPVAFDDKNLLCWCARLCLCSVCDINLLCWCAQLSLCSVC